MSTPLQVIIFFSSYLLNVLLQIANKNGIQKKFMPVKFKGQGSNEE
jgi:hypothetical protein